MKFMKAPLVTISLILMWFGLAATANAESLYRTVEFTTQPGKSAEFVEVMQVALVDTRNFDGCEHIALLVDSEDPNKVFIYEIWESEENHQAYSNWRTETGFVDTIGPYLAGPPQFRNFMLAE